MAEVLSPREDRREFARVMAQALHQEAIAHNAVIPFEEAFLSGVEWFERRLRQYFEDRSSDLHREGKPIEASQVALVAVECGEFVFSKMAEDYRRTQAAKQAGTE